MKIRCFIQFLLVVGLIIANIAFSSPRVEPLTVTHQENQMQHINGIVAIVNNQALTLAQFKQALQFARLQAEQQGVAISDGKAFENQVLESLIDQTVALQLAKMNHLSVSHAELGSVFKSIAQANHIPLTALKKHVEDKGLSFSVYRAQLKDKLLVRKLEQSAVAGKVFVSQNEVTNYLKQQQNFGGHKTLYQVAHILIAPKGSATPKDIVLAHQLAEKIKTKINKGLTFQAAAIQYSQASDALKGGVLAWSTLNGLPTIFINPVQDMKVGEIYGPFKANGAFHLIKLIAKKSSKTHQHFVEQYKLQQIMIKTSPIKTALNAKTQLMKLRAEIASNKARFNDLAKRFSDGDNAKNGGGLGWVGVDILPPAVAQALQSLNKGQLSQPIDGGNGNWYLLKLMGKREKNDTKAFVRRQARIALFNKKAEEALSIWNAQIRGASYVKIIDKNL